MRSHLSLLLCLALTLVARPALADDGGPQFHRTMPRASFDEQGGGILVMGLPGGRAWGLESELRALPSPGTTLFVHLTVSDDAVREAFVRVAYYGSATTRTRQLAIADSAPVIAHSRALVWMTLEPPAGAVAFRVRVLARLGDPAGRSSDDAVTAALHWSRGAVRPAGSLFSQLIE